MEPEPEHENEPRPEMNSGERRRDAIENRILKDIFKEEQRIKQVEKTIKKVKADNTKLDKTKRLDRAYKDIIKRKDIILSLEKKLTAYVSKQRLALARVIEESDFGDDLDNDTLKLIASLIGKKGRKKTRRKKTRRKKTRRKN